MQKANGNWKKAGMLSLIALVAAGALAAGAGAAAANGRGDDAEHGKRAFAQATNGQGQGKNQGDARNRGQEKKREKQDAKEQRKEGQRAEKDEREEQREAEREERKQQQVALNVRGPEQLTTGDTATFEVRQQKPDKPVEGAKVYALAGDRQNGLRGHGANVQAILDKDGTLLGTTDSKGKVDHAFDKAGGYVIIAIKDDYKPGTHHLKVADDVNEALAMRAPNKAVVGEQVRVAVVRKNDGQPVAGAGVYATTSGQKSVITYIQEPGAVTQQIKRVGKLLGATGADGSLSFSMDVAGSYNLLAVKDGFRPAHDHIDVVTSKSLRLGGPNTVAVNVSATFKVVGQPEGKPVAGAALYAFNAPLNTGAVLSGATSEESLVNLGGRLLGRSNDAGELSASFNTAGRYLIVAVKQGYQPAVTNLGVTPTTPTPVPPSPTPTASA